MPLIPATTTPPPEKPAWWSKFLSRKFLVAVAVIAACIMGVASGATPLDGELVALVIACVAVFVGSEAYVDATRLKVADKPGPLDDAARIVRDVAAAANR